MYVFAYTDIIFLSRKLSRELVITVYIGSTVSSSSRLSLCHFVVSGYPILPFSALRIFAFWIVDLETWNSSVTILTDQELGLKVRIWSFCFLLEIFSFSLIHSTRKSKSSAFDWMSFSRFLWLPWASSSLSSTFRKQWQVFLRLHLLPILVFFYQE